MAMGAPEVKLGTNPGYVFQFFYETNDVLEPKHFLQISGDDYAAEIDAVLPEGFGSGRYEFAFEGMTDADHKLLAAAEGGKLVVARLHLYWRDADWSGWAASYFGGIIGIDQWVGGLSEGELAKQLVAELAVVNVTRRLGARRYETVIKARERAFDHLARAKVPAGKDGTPPKSLREAVTRLIDVSKLPPATWHEAPGTNLQEEKPTPWTVGESGTAALKRLGEELEARTGKHGRGMVLIRDGVIEFGVRDIEKQKVEVLKPLTLATGLLQTDSLTQLVPDPSHSIRHPELEGVFDGRPQWQLVLRGRGDIKPGDVVQFERPPETDVTTPTVGAAFLGPFAGALLPSMGDQIDPTKAVTLYVSSVRHQLGRAAPFMTTLRGVELQEGGDAWDPVPFGRRPAVADPAEEAARAIQDSAQQGRRGTATTEIAEVRSVNLKSQGSTAPPAQTVTALRGLVDAKGAGLVNATRTLDVDRNAGTELRGAPYVTPVAFGNTGLVLPQYPGTRLVLSHRQGEGADPVAVGATWGPSARPESAQAGDYWLSLPAAVPASERTSLPAGKAPAPYKGKASHDLIDADGARVIHVGSLTVRVGSDALVDTSTRPDKAGPPIVIEHKDKKARIEIAADGSITIESPENITIKASEAINLEAKNVNVKVSDKMDVS